MAFKIYGIYIAILLGGGLTSLLLRFLKPKRQTATGFIVFFFLYAAHDYYMSVYAETFKYRYIEYVAYYIVVWLILKIFFEGRGFTNFVTVFSIDFLLQAIGTFTTAIALFPLTQLEPYTLEKITDTPSVGIYILFSFMFILAYFLARIIAGHLFKENNKFSRFLAAVLTLLNFIPGLLNSGESIYYVFPPLTVIMIGSVFYQERKIKQREEENKYYYEMEEELHIRQKELARIRHDIANHISVMDSSKDADYGGEVLQKIDESLLSGLLIVDKLIEEKNVVCSEKMISFHYELVNLSESRVKKMDWVSLLSNALDNAIEACEEVLEDKIIELDMKRKASYLVLLITNSKDKNRKPEDSHFMTTKPLDRNHGYGIGIMKESVRKYGGRIRYEDMGDRMRTYITLQAWE